uniref:O-methyltransferase C-terminal domain-containing protein n=1 Tax=Dunaliella tertiolecta TaxID=3047 RepID=A0A7S3R691_DUNTE|mmetsp:Transcript_27479/g.74343  ORF Transcript_27479/g.74343 Transcript_27479/m.74343 type:complete len:190 (+) Transcript_27479:42-611(+)
MLLHAGNFKALAQKFDFSRFSSVADIGGSTGCACVALCAHHPHLTATTCDLPAVRSVATAYIERHGMQGRVKVMDMDFFKDGFPKTDVIIMGMILHDWGLDRKKFLLKQAFDALPPGGAVICVDNLIDDERRKATLSLAMSLNMLIEFGRENSFDYTFKEFCSWTQDMGFKGTAILPLIGSTAAAIAYK